MMREDIKGVWRKLTQALQTDDEEGKQRDEDRNHEEDIRARIVEHVALPDVACIRAQRLPDAHRAENDGEQKQKLDYAALV